MKFTVGGDQETAAKIDKKIAAVDKKRIHRRTEALKSDYTTWLASATVENALGQQPQDTTHHYPLDADTSLPLPEVTKEKSSVHLKIESDDSGRQYLNVEKENKHHLFVEGDDTPDLDLGPPTGITRSDRRKTLDTLAQLNAAQHDQFGDPEIQARIAQYEMAFRMQAEAPELCDTCLLYTSPSPRDQRGSRMPSSA